MLTLSIATPSFAARQAVTTKTSTVESTLRSKTLEQLDKLLATNLKVVEFVAVEDFQDYAMNAIINRGMSPCGSFVFTRAVINGGFALHVSINVQQPVQAHLTAIIPFLLAAINTSGTIGDRLYISTNFIGIDREDDFRGEYTIEMQEFVNILECVTGDDETGSEYSLLFKSPERVEPTPEPVAEEVSTKGEASVKALLDELAIYGRKSLVNSFVRPGDSVMYRVNIGPYGGELVVTTRVPVYNLPVSKCSAVTDAYVVLGTLKEMLEMADSNSSNFHVSTEYSVFNKLAKDGAVSVAALLDAIRSELYPVEEYSVVRAVAFILAESNSPVGLSNHTRFYIALRSNIVLYKALCNLLGRETIASLVSGVKSEDPMAVLDAKFEYVKLLNKTIDLEIENATAILKAQLKD